jgi:hypothetical protein
MPNAILLLKTINRMSIPLKTNSKINNNEYSHYREIIVFILRTAGEYTFQQIMQIKVERITLLHYGQHNRIFENIKIYINWVGSTVLKPPSHPRTH